jgi:hypothetical protein
MAVTVGEAAGPRERTCPVCGGPVAPVGRRRYCSRACQGQAYRRRQAAGAPAIPPPPPGGVRVRSVYECTGCGERYLGQQRCDDCDRFCRRVGLGGECPHCGEAVAVGDLIDP